MDEATALVADRATVDAPMDAAMAAAYLIVTVDGLDKLIADDPTFPVHRLGTGPRARRRFYRSDLDAWLRSRCSAPIARHDADTRAAS